MYIVPVSTAPTKDELKWAWRFTVLSRANGQCQICGKQARLDCSHIIARAVRPDLAYEPSNGQALCRPCHMKFDHANDHRPSGRPLGYRHTDATKEKISKGNREAKASPEARAAQRLRTLAQWNSQGRIHIARSCEQCGSPMVGHKLSAGQRFCSPACHYSFRTGKSRSGY